MATVTTPRNLEQDRVKIRNPLARLRKFIHAYVSLEGVALVGLFLALWFWIGFVLDYCVFKVFLVDWVQVLPWGVRCGVLVVGLSALAALLLVYLVLRLFREFSDPSLALVLERRFPQLLGDRLITAVEMSDTKKAAAQGYSSALVTEIIHEAADRVDQLPIGQVFDWRRLITRGIILTALTLAMYLLVGGTFAIARNARGEDNPGEGFADFHEVAGIWTERNVLLRNTIWPRKAYVEILPWERTKEASALDAGGKGNEQAIDPHELRIPQNSTPPMLRVRAWKYVVADTESAEGWRLLTWADLQSRPEFAEGTSVPDALAGWTPRDESAGLTVDEVELLLEAFPISSRTQASPAKWCLASANEASGWRPLLWSDLSKEKLGGLDVPTIPGAWDAKAMPAAALSGGLVQGNPLAGAARLVVGPKVISMSVDEVEEQYNQAVKKAPDDPAVVAVGQALARLKQQVDLRETLERVAAVAAKRSMRRTMRQLVVPDLVTLTYSSLRSTSTSNMTRVAGNEYTGTFAELKESVTFTVRGEDYVTPKRTITVVERPRVEAIKSEEERPAYLYYRTSGEIAIDDIRGKRQPLEPITLSVASDTTTTDVPSGTHVTLRVTISKPLKSFAVMVEAKDQKAYKGEQPQRVDDRTFTVRLPDVRREQRFKLIFEDTDEVVGERKVVIQPKDDTSPRVREFNPDEVIRRGRGSEGHIIAVGCRIPFKGRVLDDHGLSRVRYACKVIPADFLSEQKARALLGVGGVMTLGSSGGPMLGTGYLMALNKELSQNTNDEAGPEQIIDLMAFLQAIEGHRPGEGQTEMLGKDTMLSRLKQPQKEGYRKLLREFQLTPDRWVEQWGETEDDMRNPSRWYKANDGRTPLGCDLPLWRLTWRDKDGKDKPLRDPDDTKPQKRFIIEVRLLADDTYLDGEQPVPHTSPSGETFTFVVVPENELLARIAEEEETKYKEMQKAYKPIADNLERMRDVHFALSSGPSGIDASLLTSFVARCDSLAEVLKTSHQDVRGVYVTYERIVKEMRVNQVREDILAKVFRTIYLPLAQASETQFDKAYNSVIALRRTLDQPTQSVPERVEAAGPKAADARTQLVELEKLLTQILSAMEGLSKLNELISELARIERDEELLEESVKKLYLRRVKEELEKPD